MAKHLSLNLLRISIGLFFIALGATGIVPGLQESVFSLNDRYSLELFFGIVEILCGLVLFAGLFTSASRRTVLRAGRIVLFFWVVRIIVSKFVIAISLSNSGIHFSPSFSTWILVLLSEMIIAVSIYIMNKVYE